MPAAPASFFSYAPVTSLRLGAKTEQDAGKSEKGRMCFCLSGTCFCQSVPRPAKAEKRSGYISFYFRIFVRNFML